MYKRIVSIGLLLLGLGIGQSASAGFYTTIDFPNETLWSRDFRNVFETQLTRLAFIADANLKLGGDSPMRRRYLLMEALGRDGAAHLKSLEQQLDYSVVLIRRGKAYEATQILLPLSREHPKNFLVWSHLATANFLSGNADFRDKSVLQMDQALELWPTNLKDLDPAMQKHLAMTRLDNDHELERFRRIETCLRRLMRSRLREERLAKQKKPVPDGVDPIFLDEESKEEVKPPVRFLNENGKFEVGRIAKAEKAKLPKDAVEVVEQLLIWMPTDQRLLWLLGEVFNASAMEYPDGDDRNDAIRNAYRIFQKLDPLENPPPFVLSIRERVGAMAPVAAKLPDRRVVDAKQFGLDKDEEVNPGLSNEAWWRTLGVGFLTGLAVGMFAVWQIQEVRRRRQARAAGH